MVSKRIIPCLDIKNGRTVKGVNFVGLQDAGDPVELAERYSNEGADELVFLDITATKEKRKTLLDMVEKVARKVNIPFTVGGGISSVEDVNLILRAGADKVSVNSSAVKNPQLISQLANKFGSQCVVLAVDAKLINKQWKVFLVGGRVETELNLYNWVSEAVNLGAGEILFTSMDHDGTKNGFANEALKNLSELVNVPIIASGGAGSIKHFTDTFVHGRADAALAASVFHYKQIEIKALKNELKPSRCKCKNMNINFDKNTGLIPAIIQDSDTGKVLMLGYMNRESYDKTQATKLVTFYSRSKQRLWTKGEESGHYLHVHQIANDCDQDTLLIQASPAGPTCHKGSDTCWGERNKPSFGFLSRLEQVIKSRKTMDPDKSYVSSLFQKGINKIAQKVGEEAVEVVIESKDDNEKLFLDESADLLFHYMILLEAKGYSLNDVVEVLKRRHK